MQASSPTPDLPAGIGEAIRAGRTARGESMRALAARAGISQPMLSKLENFAEERGHPMVELAIAWLLGNSRVCSVIAGATKPEQATANAKAADWHLTTEDMREIDEILKSRVG